jgi:hypothetical protein
MMRGLVVSVCRLCVGAALVLGVTDIRAQEAGEAAPPALVQPARSPVAVPLPGRPPAGTARTVDVSELDGPVGPAASPVAPPGPARRDDPLADLALSTAMLSRPEPDLSTLPFIDRPPVDLAALPSAALPGPPPDDRIPPPDQAIDAQVAQPGETVTMLEDGLGFRILYQPDAETFDGIGGTLLTGLVDRLIADPAIRLEIRAYAGTGNGSARRARQLSLQRALNVRAFVIDRGIRNTRIDVRALGDQNGGGPPDRVDILLIR